MAAVSAMANAPADDESMFQMATSIKARAIRRCGQLLREIKPAKGMRTDLQPREKDALPKLTRLERGDLGHRWDDVRRSKRVRNGMPPRSADGRFTRREAPSYPTVRLHAISCCVCDELGPIARTSLLAINPPARSGFRELVIHGVAGWWCRRCLRTRERHLPPATRGECVDSPRPCKRVLCRYHLVDSISRKAKDDFRLPESCALDVADKNPEGLTLREVGALVGMTREGVREIQLRALENLRQAGIDLEELAPTHAPGVVDSAIGRLSTAEPSVPIE